MIADTRRLAPKPTKRQLAKIDREIERCFYLHGRNVQISVLKIGTIYEAGRAAALAGGDLEAAVIAAIALVREN
jgi:hypothetical protein